MLYLLLCYFLKYLTDCAAKIIINTSELRLVRRSFLAHSSDINDLLEGLDGVLKDWFYVLHDSKCSFHIINLWLHSLDSFHFPGNFNEWLSIIKSLKDSGSQRFLDVLDSSGLGNSGVSVTSGLGSLSRDEGG